MKIISIIFLTFLYWGSSVSEASCTGTEKAWFCQAGTPPSEIQTAINSALDGATITFENGSYTWGDGNRIRFSASKGISLVCQSMQACIVNYTSTAFVLPAGFSTKLYRISGFTFNQSVTGSWLIQTCPGGTCPKTQITSFRFDHNLIKQRSAQVMSLGQNDTQTQIWGVIDHNEVTCPTSCMLAIMWGPTLTPDPPSSRGTPNNLFIEDNLITITQLTNTGSGCIDGYGGMAVVIRFNTSINCVWLSHGVQHGGGPSNTEFYGNLVIMNNGASGTVYQDCYRCFHSQGGGEYYLFNNAFTAYSGHNGSPIAVMHYRDFDNKAPLGQCDGTNGIDGNRSPSSTYAGYPCWHQPGRDFYGKLNPIYAWGNFWTDTLALAPFALENYGGYYGQHFKYDRDAYNAVSASQQSSPTTPFDGSTGMGFGTLENRPPTCKPTSDPLDAGHGGVGYWAIDQGSWMKTPPSRGVWPQPVGSSGTLYACTTANNWTVIYIPFQYPYPLTLGGGAPPDPPANLKRL